MMSTTQDMRASYNDTLIELAEKDDRIVVLEADLMKASGTVPFKERFPERTFDMGVAEANMVGVAAGLSSVGKIPFAASFTSFAGRKTYDQFFISANYARLNVKLVGTDPGISAVYNGGTHMSFEDGGIMRDIPKLVVFEPSDNISLRALVKKSADYYGCTYMRLHRKGGQNIHSKKTDFQLGKGVVLRDGTDITIIATGFLLVPEALAAAEALEKEGISAAVIDMHTVKPIDRDLVVHYAKKTGAIVTCENHQVMNYLGSAVAEVLSEEHPTIMGRVGVQDEFGEVGTLDYLKERFGLNADEILKKAKEVLKKKE
jgi:transketolase